MSEGIDELNGGGHVRELLSEYLDGGLDGLERERVRGHLEVCAGCREEYAGLRATQRLVRSLPAVAPPRAFTLTEEMVARRPGFWARLLAPSNVPRFATGSVLSFALLVMLLLGNVLTVGSPTASVASLRAPQAAALEPTTTTAAAAPEESQSRI